MNAMNDIEKGIAEPGAALLARMPATRGRVEVNASLARWTWFAVGGPADILFHPADEADLASFLAALPADAPVTVMGVGSNLLFRDGGIRGVVIRLGRAFSELSVTGTRLTAGGGALDVNVAIAAGKHGIAGLEFLRGIPGTVGGAVKMNAGAFGGEVADILVSAAIVKRSGEHLTLAAGELGFGYRRSAVARDAIVTAATFEGHRDTPRAIEDRMNEIRRVRAERQPMGIRTGGSTFKNPDNADGRTAWQLIDAAGCRGLRCGGAQVSEKHCNFLVNSGNATAADIEGLGEEIRRRVLDMFGVTLEWEIERIGEACTAEGAAP